MTKKRILFIHPDLGIGGAERLVVDAAVGLQERGHSVTIYTSHCDKRHCFDEARDGTLDVRVAGNSIIPPNLLGRFSILCAILRQVHLSLTLLLTNEISKYDYIFIDQLSAAIPLLRFFSPKTKILFYCHFPDYLLATRASFIKSLYRIPFDWFEGFTTGLADTIVVNSAFTKSIFATAFPRIGLVPRVVYPCVTTTIASSSSPSKIVDTDPPFSNDGRKIILSINRFERKKNIDLAITSYSLLTPEQRCQSRLVIAGGYDARVSENVTHHSDLAMLCEKLGLKSATSRNFISSLSVPEDTDVLFLLSIPATLKAYLLKTASLLVYTPAREHFGIVPLEAMIAGVPVLAHNSGGPLETIEEGKTGWLRPAEEGQWVAVMRMALFELEEKVIAEMATRGRERVLELFSKEKMAQRLDDEFDEISETRSIRGLVLTILAGMGVVIGLGTAFALS
ncbi:UDP-Glycosyltransferase/glycogen phosphorylase [Choiromyces venosus 120613-1]|uniref:Alpha-1,3/1,6-mannosyltransferase ALG2 n=1 Tax=Choiromyces venosus 120613-1 TaxID=1336337 RepID=A0A3N4J376_9PEZI|nr:UDP-Glycosyltransferase/glycogen phosphorylase [Choiromyces venosus 120613-1]